MAGPKDGKHVESTGPALRPAGMSYREPAQELPHWKRGAPSRGEQEPPNKKVKSLRQITVHQPPPKAILEDGQVDLPQFMDAHKSNIDVLDRAMKDSKSSSTKRAFQKVPRDMRRRTASHNPNKVPKRLRGRAIREMVADNTPVKKGVAKGWRANGGVLNKKAKGLSSSVEEGGGDDEAQRRPMSRKARREERDRLPTHKWHTKRTKMSTRADVFYDRPTPIARNSKCARTIHRAYSTSAFISDSSNRGFLELSGSSIMVLSALEHAGIGYRDASENHRWIRGSQVWTGMIRAGRTEPSELVDICPARVIWNPARSSTHGNTEETGSITDRQVLVEVEPHGKDDVLQLFEAFLHDAKEIAMSDLKPAEVRDLSRELGCIDITGSASTDKLAPFIRGYRPSNGEDISRSTNWRLFWALEHVQLSMLQNDIFLGFTVGFPWGTGAIFHPTFVQGDEVEMLLEAQTAWSSDVNPQPLGLLDDTQRRMAAQMIRSKETAGSHVPGGDDEAGPSAPSSGALLPILLFCSPSREHAVGGRWSVVCPRDAVAPLWHNIIKRDGGKTQVACVEERHQIHTERGLPFFPNDFPTTRAGIQWELKNRELLAKQWKRLPPGKRTNFANLDLGSTPRGEHGDPFCCDWQHLLLPNTPSGNTAGQKVENATSADSHLLLTAGLVSVHARVLRNQAINPPVQERSDKPTIPQYGLFTIRVTMVNGGIPKPRARIYRLRASRDDEDRRARDMQLRLFEPSVKQKEKLIHEEGEAGEVNSGPLNTKSSQGIDRRFAESQSIEERTAVLAASLCLSTDAVVAAGGENPHATESGGPTSTAPPNTAIVTPVYIEDLLGFVTSGGFNFAKGKGQGIGHVGAVRVCNMLREEQNESTRLTPKEPASLDCPLGKKNKKRYFRCLVRNVGETVSYAAIWEVVDEQHCGRL